MKELQMNENYNSPEYKRSRAAYSAECAFEYFVSLLVADAFLSNLLSSMGLDDSTIGIISSLISLAFLFQLFSVFVAQRITNVKLVAVTIHCISQMFFMFLYLVPFLPFAGEFKTITVFACIIIAYFGNYLVTTVIFDWGNSFVDPEKRARYAAGKEMASLLSGIFVTLFMGYMVDRFAQQGNVKGGFIFTACMILLINACDFLCLMLIKNRIVKEKEPKKEPFLQVIGIIFKNKSFVYVIILSVLWNVSNYMILGFMGIYKTKDLLLSVGVVQIINIVGCLFRFAFSKPFGKYTDKRSYAKGLELGILVAAAGFAVNIFTTPSLWWIVILYTVLNNIAMAGISQNLINITYSYVDRKYFVPATAIKNSISGLCGFLASVAGGKILEYVQSNNNTFFGIKVYGQQVLSFISLAVAVVTIVFIKTVMEKQKIIAK